MPNRLLVDLKEDHKGHITGTIKLPADSRFVFEAVASVIETFASSCEVPPVEIARDLATFLEK